MPSSNLNLVGLFAGVGGIEEGFFRAGFNPVVANELDPYAVETYREMHRSKKQKVAVLLDSISNVTRELLEEQILLETGDRINLEGGILTGGFPCQPFSVAGYRKGFDDERGNVFWDIIKLANEIRPDVIFLENVKNLATHDEKRTLATIRAALKGEKIDREGAIQLYQEYFLAEPEVLNAKDFGVPQNRERIFLVAFKDKEAASNFKFPTRADKSTSHGLASLERYIDFDTKQPDKYYYTEDSAIYDRLVNEVTERGVIYQWRRQYVRANKSGVAPTLTANMGMGGHNVPIIKAKHGIRKLTPEECFRLMGFERLQSKPGTADSRLYKQAGNAVVVDVIESIARNIKTALQR